MNEDIIQDLKQFITATVSQATADLATKDVLKNLATKDDIQRIEDKVDSGFAGIGDAIESIQEHETETENRLTNLEQQAT